jgi:hypothetical protein
VFSVGPLRGYISGTEQNQIRTRLAERVSAVQSRVQLWSVNQRITEVKIRYQETSSEDTVQE